VGSLKNCGRVEGPQMLRKATRVSGVLDRPEVTSEHL